MEQFFRDLSQLKQFGKWKVSRLSGMIRGCGPCLCPINAVAVYRGVYINFHMVDYQLLPFPYPTVIHLSRRLGLYDYQAGQIIVASDNFRNEPDFDPALRQRLLDTLGLQEAKRYAASTL